MAENADIKWSECTRTLRDIADTVSFPCVVRVCEDYERGNEISSFALGDLIKIDSCEVVKKIRGGFVEWVNASGECAGRFSEIVGEDVSMLVSNKGCVRVLPKYGVYHVYSAAEDIITDLPRYIEVLDQIIGITTTGDSVTVKKGDVLETVHWNKSKDKRQTCCYLKCKHNGNKTLQIPSSTIGRFRVLRDDIEYTLQEVIQRFPLPQIVQFTEQISKEQISLDIKKAIENLDNFEGKIMLDKFYSEQILFGQYKSLHPDQAANTFLKRTAIMIPLSDPELEEITVQYPLYLDSQDYEAFVIKNFLDMQVGRQAMDRSLYMEFTKKSSMRFLEINDSPSSEHQYEPSPCPPRRAASKVAPVRPLASKSKEHPVEDVKLPLKSTRSTGWLRRREVKLPLLSERCKGSLNRQEGLSILNDLQGGILSDVDWGSSGGSSKLTDDMEFKTASEGQGMKEKFIGFFKKPKSHSKPTTTDSPSISDNSEEETDYDYQDLDKELNTPPKNCDYLSVVMGSTSIYEISDDDGDKDDNDDGYEVPIKCDYQLRVLMDKN